jgi:hypothetical protein
MSSRVTHKNVLVFSRWNCLQVSRRYRRICIGISRVGRQKRTKGKKVKQRSWSHSDNFSATSQKTWISENSMNPVSIRNRPLWKYSSPGTSTKTALWGWSRWSPPPPKTKTLRSIILRLSPVSITSCRSRNLWLAARLQSQYDKSTARKTTHPQKPPPPSPSTPPSHTKNTK